MEERIATAESRGAGSGLAFQSFLNALQQRSAKSFKAKPAQEPDVPAPEPFEELGEGSETWRRNLFLTPKKLQARWEQYSPSLKDKLHRYSPNPIKKLKEYFSQSEERTDEEREGEKDVETMEDDKDGNEIVKERQDEYKRIAAIYLEKTSDDEGDGRVNLNDDSSQKERVPSDESSFIECDNEVLVLPGSSSPNLGLDPPPYIVLQEPEPSKDALQVIGVESEVVRRRKSPLTVQEWVDHLPSKSKLIEKDCEDSSGSKDSDNVGCTEVPPHEDKRSLFAARLSREASVQSSSSLDSLLDSRRPDPVEVLLNLGFGGVPGVDLDNCRIPKRFLVPSKCKGGDWNEFLRRELLQAQNFECASLGFRGLSGPSHLRPSAIVANIMEKLRERTTPRPPANKSRFSTVARRVLHERSVLNKLTPEPQSASASVLSPDNRKFLESQGKISPEVPRRRIIIGQKSFAFANDGELIEVEPTVRRKTMHKDSTTSLCSSTSAESDSEDSKPQAVTLRSPDAMLKLRRSSLQRQKKIEADDEDENHYAENNGQSKGTNRINHQSDEGFSKRPEKIPPRFVSSGNLKLLLEKEKTPEEIRLELEAEIKTLSQKIQFSNSDELSSILLQMKELRSRLDSQ